MGYTFISFVGQQNLGVQNPLEACLQAKNSDNTSKFDIDKIILMPTEKTIGNAADIKKYGEKHGYPPIEIMFLEKKGIEGKVIEELCSKYEQIIFNSDGGMNYQVTIAVSKLFHNNAYSVVSNTDTAKLLYKILNGHQIIGELRLKRPERIAVIKIEWSPDHW